MRFDWDSDGRGALTCFVCAISVSVMFLEIQTFKEQINEARDGGGSNGGCRRICYAGMDKRIMFILLENICF